MIMLKGNWLAGPGRGWGREWEAKKSFRCDGKVGLKRLISHYHQKVIWLSQRIHVQILWSVKALLSLHNDEPMVCQLWVGAMVFLPSLSSVAQKRIRPIRFLGCNHPYLNFLPCVYWISFFFFFCYPFFQYFQLFQLFFLCSFFPIHLQRPTCAADGPAAQPMDVGKTASAREHQLFFLLTEHPMFMTDQWRRVGECSQIKQKKFALVISMWESCPWLMVLQ